MPIHQSRRNVLKSLAATTAAFGSATLMPSLASCQETLSPQSMKGNIKHAVCRWCFNSIPLEEFCISAKKIGIEAIDLVGPGDWPILKKHGLDSSMCNGAEINLVHGWNNPTYHAKLIERYSEMIPKVAQAGYKNLICFSGNRDGMDDETGLKNCTTGLKQIMKLAEQHKVVIVMELLNSKIDHKDYQCDKTPWGAELVRRVGSDNFRLLYDIYHMQIDEGDVIRTIRDNHQYIAHYHTAGVPGRHEIDDTQELFYPAIMKAIVETGFKGYVAQEFIPARDKKEEQLASLQRAVQICDV